MNVYVASLLTFVLPPHLNRTLSLLYLCYALSSFLFKNILCMKYVKCDFWLGENKIISTFIKFRDFRHIEVQKNGSQFKALWHRLTPHLKFYR